jgi:hypothetical protein
MSEVTTLNTTLKQILNVLMQSTNRIVTAINKVGSILAKTSVIGRKLSTSAFGKETGITKIGQFNQMIDQMFQGVKGTSFGSKEEGAPKGGIFSGLTKDFKGVQKLFKNVGKTIGSKVGGAFKSLGPQMLMFALIMEPLQALIGAFLEPLEALTPLFEAWGGILSQLLIPVVQILLAVLMPLTPAFVAIAEALLPLIELLASSVGWLVPVVEILASLIILIARFGEVMIQLWGWLRVGFETITAFAGGFATFFTGLFEGISNFFLGISNFFTTLWANIINGVRNFGDAIGNFFSDLWNGLLEAGRNFLEGGFDGDPDTWW